MFKNLIVSLVTIILVSGCSTRVDNFYELAKSAFTEPTDTEFNQGQIENLRYAAIYVKTDSTPQIVAILNRVSGDPLQPQRNWVSGDREIIVTQHGRIVTSEGLDRFPRQVTNTHRDPLLCFVEQHRVGQPFDNCPTQWRSQVEYNGHGTLAATRLFRNSEFTYSNQPESYTHPDGTALETYRITENVTVQPNDLTAIQSYTNEYWISNGRVVKSVQWISPEHRFATLTEVKPYGGDILE